MRACLLLPAVATALGTLALADEPITFPAEYPSQTLYASVENERLKMIRQVYADAAMVKAVKAHQPLPAGSVVTMPMYRVQVDEKQAVVKAANGHLIRAAMFGIFVMRKHEDSTWGFASFTPDGKPDPNDTKVCIDCHGKEREHDWIHTMTLLLELAKEPVGVTEASQKAAIPRAGE